METGYKLIFLACNLDFSCLVVARCLSRKGPHKKSHSRDNEKQVSEWTMRTSLWCGSTAMVTVWICGRLIFESARKLKAISRAFA